LLSCNGIFAATGKSHKVRKVPDQYLLYESVDAAIKTGNAVIYTVPVAVESDGKATMLSWHKNCGDAPNISVLGQRQARAIARGIFQSGVPLGTVSSSEDCVAMTTATYIKSDPALRIRITPDLAPPDIQQKNGIIDAVIQQHIRAYFNVRRVALTTLIVGHEQTQTTTIHPILTDLKPGETAIFVVPKFEQFDFIAKLNWQQWNEMSNYITNLARKSVKAKVASKRGK
jgi:hypothetical protein